MFCLTSRVSRKTQLCLFYKWSIRKIPILSELEKRQNIIREYLKHCFLGTALKHVARESGLDTAEQRLYAQLNNFRDLATSAKSLLPIKKFTVQWVLSTLSHIVGQTRRQQKHKLSINDATAFFQPPSKRCTEEQLSISFSCCDCDSLLMSSSK